MKPARVLIIDDEPSLGQALARALRALHYDVALAADAPAAYQLLHEGTFDAVLLDVRLGTTMGDALYFALTRQWPYLRGRVVLMSGEPAPPEGEWPPELEHCPFLLKPFGLELLGRTLAAVVGSGDRRQNGTA
jgi:DNA-binding NtrC family response regulator